MASTETAQKKDPIIVALAMPRSLHALLTKDAKREDKTIAATIRTILKKAYKSEK